MKEQDYYQLYRKKTIEAGYVPVGRQRFAGIIKTISLIPETISHITEKQANGVQSENGKLPIPHVNDSLLPLDVYKKAKELSTGEFINWWFAQKQ